MLFYTIPSYLILWKNQNEKKMATFFADTDQWINLTLMFEMDLQ